MSDAGAPTEFVLRSARVVTPSGVRPASIHVRDGVIHDVLEADATVSGIPYVDAGDAAVSPGLVDTHVHINEPGRTEWEGFQSATLAAAAGGVTTLVDMPLNCIPATTTVHALEAKRAAASGRCYVDVGFWGGLVPGNETELESLLDAGALGFKCFLVGSGVAEFEPVGEDVLRRALPLLALSGSPLLVHAELSAPIDAATPAAHDDPHRYATYLSSRPAEAEVRAVELLVRLGRETGARLHVVHVSAAEVLPLLCAARRAGVHLTAETCPHYLHFTDDDVADGATLFKCAPPIRGRANRERLWAALAEGDLDMIVSDHSPCTPDLKSSAAGDFMRAWGGIASLGLALAVTWTGAAARGHDIADLAKWLSAGPAQLAGLVGSKGAIAQGMDADLVVWQPDVEWRIERHHLRQRHPLSPYLGVNLRGVVEATYLRGQKVYDRGVAVGPPRGRLLAHSGVPWISRS